jgi:hypothetical protein
VFPNRKTAKRKRQNRYGTADLSGFEKPAEKEKQQASREVFFLPFRPVLSLGFSKRFYNPNKIPDFWREVEQYAFWLRKIMVQYTIQKIIDTR